MTRAAGLQGNASQSYDDVQAFFGQAMDAPLASPRPVGAAHSAGRHTDPGHIHAMRGHAVAGSDFQSGYSAPGHAPYYVPAPQHGGMMPMGTRYGPPEHHAMLQPHPAYPGQPQMGYMMVPQHHPPYVPYGHKAAAHPPTSAHTVVGPGAEHMHGHGSVLPKCASWRCGALLDWIGAAGFAHVLRLCFQAVE